MRTYDGPAEEIGSSTPLPPKAWEKTDGQLSLMQVARVLSPAEVRLELSPSAEQDS